MIRQGDVFIVPIKKIPAKVAPVERENGRVVLAHGEATGHAHAISNRGVAMFREDGSGGGLYMTVTGEPATIEHEEHTHIAVPPGNYKIVRQREWHAGMARRVAD